MKTNPCDLMLSVMDRLFPERPGWEHGTAMSMLRPLSVEQAMWRARPEGRCIWEIVRHMQHWRRFVAERLGHVADAKPGQAWPVLPETEDPALLAALWEEELDGLERTQALLLERLAVLDPAEPCPHPDMAHEPHWVSAVGVQIHDSFHLGQIAMLRGMQGLPAVD